MQKQSFWLSVNSNGVTDNVKLCAEHARILHKAIPCHSTYQVPPYVSLERPDCRWRWYTGEGVFKWYRRSLILFHHDSLVLYIARLPRSIMYLMNAHSYDQNIILPFKSNMIEIKVEGQEFTDVLHVLHLEWYLDIPKWEAVQRIQM